MKLQICRNVTRDQKNMFRCYYGQEVDIKQHSFHPRGMKIRIRTNVTRVQSKRMPAVEVTGREKTMVRASVSVPALDIIDGIMAFF